MRKDSRLSRLLHALIHMDMLQRGITSDELGKMLGTNPVVVRRTMALLKKAGYVSSVKGHNGGWHLETPLNQITLYDIQQLVGEASLFTIGLTDEHNNCPIEKAVNNAISGVLQEAEALVLARFKDIKLSTLRYDEKLLAQLESFMKSED